MVCCLGLVLLSQRLSKAIAPGTTLLQGWRDPDDRLHSRICDTVLIVLALLLLLPPLLAVIVDGVNRQLPEVLAQPVLWQALWTSLRIALAAGVLCVVLTMMLLWSSRELRARQKNAGGSGAGDERHVDPRHAGDCAGYRLLFYCSTTPLACRNLLTAL